MNLTMHDDEVSELLDGPRVGILAISRPGAAPPLVAPVWYAPVVDGTVVVVTGRSTAKVRLLEGGAVATFLVQEEHPPRHVAAAVDVELLEADRPTRRAIAVRYVPPDLLDGYLAATSDADVVLLRMHPRSWRSVDLGRAATTPSGPPTTSPGDP